MTRMPKSRGEGSLVFFTLLAQSGAGLVVWSLATHAWALRLFGPEAAVELLRVGESVAAGMVFLGLAFSLHHLGTPRNAWRALSNWRSSWLSREIALAGSFAVMCALAAAGTAGKAATPPMALAMLAVTALAGAGLLGVMSRAYQLRTVPAWNRWTTPATFILSALLLGGLAAIALLLGVLVPPEMIPGGRAADPFAIVGAIGVLEMLPILRAAGAAVIVLALAQVALFHLWVGSLRQGTETEARAARRITSTRPALWRLRTILVLAGAALGIASLLLPSLRGAGIASVAAVAFVVSEAAGRLLFYEGRVRLGL